LLGPISTAHVCRLRLSVPPSFLPQGAIELIDGAGCNSAHLVQNTLPPVGAGVGTAVPARSRFAHRLNVSECDRIFNLAADSAHSAAQWMAAIETAARQHTVGGLVDGSAAAANASACAEAAAMANVPVEMRSTVAQMAPEGQVTFVFTDVQNSTNLWEAAPDEMNDALEIHDAVMRDLLVVYRGYEVKTEGDAFMVTFFTPLDALLWCMAVQRALLRSDWPKALLAQPAATSVADAQTGAPSFAGIRVRMGVHTGFPNCRRNPVTGRMDYFGPVVNLSARISDTAHGGQIVCSRDVHDALVVAQQLPAESLDARLGDFRPVVVDHGQYPLKGIKDLTSIIQVSSHELASRVFPPLRATKQ
jgi:class 3 adenylate cyclase